ncbi:MAG: hypothetical protein JJ855_06105 [Rhodospirillales bacterium]|nr:hypothetical protein [Rhodospirillales bacterium]
MSKPKSKSTKALFAPIEDARRKRMDWIAIADAVTELKNAPVTRTTFSTREEFWEAAAAASGYTRNALQRMATTVVRIREIEQANKESIKKCLSRRKWSDDILLEALDHFPKAEIFARIHRLEPAEAWQLLERMQTEKFSVIRLKEILRDISNTVPRTQQFSQPGAGKAVVNERFAMIDAHKSEIYADDAVNIYFRRYRFPLVSADAVALSCNEDGGIEFIDAFQIVSSISKKSDEGFRDLVSGIDFKTSFFRHVWLFLADPADMDTDQFNPPIERLSRAVDELGISRLGIVTISDDAEFRVLRRPKGNDKPARYQNALTEVMRQGVPDFGVV